MAAWTSDENGGLAMIACKAIPSRSAATLQVHPRRWVSYEKSTLTTEAILQKVEAGLGKDVQGKPLRIDLVTKTLSTAAGRLPISPVLDPAWIKPRRRPKKDRPTELTGRFRQKLARNPYAEALATPLRRCVNTNVTLPRYFLQDFEQVTHPSTQKPWWAPGPLSLDHVSKWSPPRSDDFGVEAEKAVIETTVEAIDESKSPQTSASTAPSDQQIPRTGDDHVYTTEATSSSSSSSSQEQELPEPIIRPYRAPLTAYALCRKSVIDLIGTKKKYTSALMSMRSGMAATPESRQAVWRPDMGDVLLAMFRRRATDALIDRGRPTKHEEDQSIYTCATWNDIQHVVRRGCVLWLPAQKDAAQQYATWDIEEAHYGSKMAVHNLYWLLGDAEAGRLKKKSAMFRSNEIMVLTHWSSMNMMRLHMLLWRLQGYLEPAASLSSDSRT
ncbi:hypothetical protein CP532_6619 [Ophiocordyceps camponoti-leonardi (nom. inval.)]|nr:hypothetical protein CP532_6619 [Ophiocordyceps camponoti-leonardi (nom. inval.)]